MRAKAALISEEEEEEAEEEEEEGVRKRTGRNLDRRDAPASAYLGRDQLLRIGEEEENMAHCRLSPWTETPRSAALS